MSLLRYLSSSLYLHCSWTVSLGALVSVTNRRTHAADLASFKTQIPCYSRWYGWPIRPLQQRRAIHGTLAAMTPRNMIGPSKASPVDIIDQAGRLARKYEKGDFCPACTSMCSRNVLPRPTSDQSDALG